MNISKLTFAWSSLNVDEKVSMNAFNDELFVEDCLEKNWRIQKFLNIVHSRILLDKLLLIIVNLITFYRDRNGAKVNHSAKMNSGSVQIHDYLSDSLRL